MTDEPKIILQGAFGGDQQQTEVRQEVQQEPAAPAPPPDPVEAPDNLRSNSFARIIDVLGEGEIEGLVDRSGRVLLTQAEFGKAIFVDETPLLQSDGKPNFQGFKVGMTWGTADQNALTGFGPASEVEYSGVEVKFGLPISVGINNPNADRIEVAVRIPSLLTQDKKTGNINGGTVTYRVDLSLNDGAFSALQTVIVKGKTRNPYLKSTSHVLPHSDDPDNDSWTVRVVRITKDAPDLTIANATVFEFVTVYTKNQFRYPYSAMVAAEVNARGFSGIPSRAYRVRGIRVKLPNNYFPDTRLYNRDPLTGDPVVDGDSNPIEQVWNGGMYVAWSDNPAWCFFDLMTSRRYGLGDYMGVTDSNPYGTVDRWSLYAIAKYCDVFVDNGFGIMEPRFTCNLVIASAEEAWKVMQDMASVFRGILYWNQGAIVAVQDKPKIIAASFTNANVDSGMFAYVGTAKKARHTVAAVRWNDPGDFYRPKYEYVEDAAAIARYGYRKTEISAFGCTSRGQAHRLGKWTLLTENFATDTCSFKAGQEGAYLRPGDLISVIDNDRAGVMQGGRIVGIGADRKSITLDRSVTLPAGVSTVTLSRPQAFVAPADITDSSQIDALRTAQIVEVTATNAAGATLVLTFADALPDAVEVPCIFLVKTVDVTPALYRVLTVEEIKEGQYGVSALEYNESIFDATETDIALEVPDFSDLPERPGIVLPPQDLTLTRAPAITEGGIVLKILVSWEMPPDASINSFLVEYRLDQGNWIKVDETAATSAEVVYQVAGTYDVRVTSINNVGARSDGIIATVVVPNTNPIELVSIVGLELVDGANSDQFQGRDAKFSWRLVSPQTQDELGQEVQAGSGFSDPYFEVFEFAIFDVSSGNQVWREEVSAANCVFTFEKNLEAGGPYNQFRVQVRALDKFRNASPAASITVTNPAPGAPTSTSIGVSWRTVALDWLNATDVDLAGVEIYMGTSAVFADAGLLATLAVVTPGSRGTYIRTGLPIGTHFYFWLKSIDTFGTRSAQAPTGGLDGITGAIETTDIADFAVTATKLFVTVIVLTGDLWLDNSPGAGQIAWNAHSVVFRGVTYAIAAGDTPNVPPIAQYVWWRGPIVDPTTGNTTTPGETIYRTSVAHPKDLGVMLENDFIIATNANAAGVHDLAWRGIANAVIGSAFIRDAAIQDAHIDNVSADKITAGDIVGHTITLVDSMTDPSILQSNNYVAGVSGWAIFGDGTAEFNDVTIRGSIAIGGGYFNPAYPGRLFLAEPTLSNYGQTFDFGAAVPVGKTYVCNPTSHADPRDAIDNVKRSSYMQYSTTGAAQKAHFVLGGFSGGNAVASQRVDRLNVFFTGPTLQSTLVTATGGVPNYYNLGLETDGILYRRLGRADINAFKIRMWGNCVKWFSLYFMVFDPPAANDNTYPNFGDSTHPWNFIVTVIGDGSATRRLLDFTTFQKILVPDNKCIIFGIAPYDVTDVAGDSVMTGYGVEVTPLNVGTVDF